MAWVKEYDLVWSGQYDTGTIEIQRDGGAYVGPLKLTRGSLQVRQTLPDWETHIVQTACSFTISNEGTTAATWQDLLPLMTISEGQYRVVVIQDDPIEDLTLFMGYINCEAVSQDMIYYSELRITASGLLNKLQYIEPTGITDPIHNDSFINIIDHCLRLTGAEYNIRVGCSLESGARFGYDSDQSMFSECGVTTELFWVDNVERKNALEVLEMILTPFNCYLYWFQDYWYIDYYEDLGVVSRPYVEYTTGTSYKVDDVGAALTVTTQQWQVYSQTHPQEAGTQTLSVNPGLNQLELKLDQQQFFNMVDGSMTVMEEGTSPGDVYYREWYGQDTGIFWFGESRLGYSPPQIWPVSWLTIANAFGRIIQHDTAASSWEGLHTRFKCSIYPDSEITFDWKSATTVLPEEAGPGGTGASDAFYDTPESINVRFYWTAYNNTTSEYIKYDANADPEWTLEATNPSNYFTVTAAAFDLKRTMYEPSISIPIGSEEYFPTLADFSSLGTATTMDITFIIGMCVLEETDNPLWPNSTRPDGSAPMKSEYIGDVSASVTGSAEANTITGETISNFLDKKTISLSLFDTENWNYRNSIMKDRDGANYYINKTFDWSTADHDNIPLTDVLMASKFRLYRVARQKIKMTNYITSLTFWHQFRIGEVWTDSKQTGLKFILAEDVHTPDLDKHDLTLFEYDDTEEITLL